MKYLLYFFTLAGSLIIGNYIGIYILGNYTVFQTGYFEFSNYITLYSKSLGYHLLGLIGAILLLISSFFQIKSEQNSSKRSRALLVDFLIIFVIYVFFDSIENNNESEGVLSFKFLQGEYFKSKVAFFLILVSLYYFIGEISGGTIGKRMTKLKSESQDSKKGSTITILAKTIVYVFPILIMYLYLLLSGTPVFKIVDTGIYRIYLYTSYLYYFILILFITIGFRNHIRRGRIE